MWTWKLATPALARTGLLFGAIVCIFAGASSRAQVPRDQPGHRLDLGLFTMFGGRVLAVTLTDVGAPDVVSFVRIRVLNGEERVIVSADRVLKPGQPARLEVPFARDLDWTLARVSIQITGTPGRLTAPVAVVEDIDPASKTLVVRGLCSAPGPRINPVTPLCPGWEITDIAAAE
jgi:hypothetical protein